MENLAQNNLDVLKNMSDADKRDLQQTVNNEMQKLKIQEGFSTRLPFKKLFFFFCSSELSPLQSSNMANIYILDPYSGAQSYRRMLQKMHND